LLPWSPHVNPIQFACMYSSAGRTLQCAKRFQRWSPALCHKCVRRSSFNDCMLRVIVRVQSLQQACQVMRVRSEKAQASGI
jgi:hypothetical protein